MFNKLIIASLYFVIFSLASEASILTKEQGPKEIAGIKIASRATLSYKSQVANLEPLAAALRTKKVVLVNVNVYVELVRRFNL